MWMMMFRIILYWQDTESSKGRRRIDTLVRRSGPAWKLLLNLSIVAADDDDDYYYNSR